MSGCNGDFPPLRLGSWTGNRWPAAPVNNVCDRSAVDCAAVGVDSCTPCTSGASQLEAVTAVTVCLLRAALCSPTKIGPRGIGTKWGEVKMSECPCTQGRLSWHCPSQGAHGLPTPIPV